MNFQKQIQFSRHIKVGGRLREFNFLKVNHAETPTYKVDVSDERGWRFNFLLMSDGRHWKVFGEDLPKWIVESEEKLQKEVQAQQPDAS